MVRIELSEALAAVPTGFSTQAPPRIAIDLPLTREAMADYLGLTLETVSRAFSKFHADGLIEVEQKFIRIRDIDRLKQIYAHHVS